MMKIYSPGLIKSIQSVIDSTRFTITTFHEYDFMTTLNTAEIIIKFYVDPKLNRRECALVINNCDMSSKFVNDWKQTAPGTFCAKDYKKDRRDFIGNTLYHELKFKLNGEKIKVLIRLLNEITEPEITEEQKEEYINKYGDITIDGKYFSVIKITKDDDMHFWGSWDQYKSIDTFVDVEIYEGDSYINEDNDNDIDNIPDDSMSSDPLF